MHLLLGDKDGLHLVNVLLLVQDDDIICIEVDAALAVL